MTARKTYEDGDNPIDWSSFEAQEHHRANTAPHAGALKAVSWTALGLTVVGIVFGGYSLFVCLVSYGDGLSSLDSLLLSESAWHAIFLIVLIVASFLTLIPAAYGFQVVSGAAAAPALVLGVLGVLTWLFCMFISTFDLGSLWLLIIFTLAAAAYLLFAFRAWTAGTATGGRGTSKEELWDEDTIWG